MTTENIIKIKSQYESKCADCGKEIKVGWDCYFQKNPKAVYCAPCGRKRLHVETSPKQELTEEYLATLPKEVADELRKLGLVKPPTIEDRMKAIEHGLDDLISTTRLIYDIVLTLAETKAYVEASKELRQKKSKETPIIATQPQPL